MGKRKTSTQAPVKKSAPLSTSFKCLFCHHDKSVNVKLDKGTMFGHLNCKVCGQKFTAPINNLSAAVDIYCDWVDACEEVRQKQPKAQRPKPGPDPLAHGPQGGVVISNVSRRDDDVDDDDDDDADGEDEADLAPPSKSKGGRHDDPDEDEDEDEVEERGDDGGGKKRRVDYDDDDDDDDDDDE